MWLLLGGLTKLRQGIAWTVHTLRVGAAHMPPQRERPKRRGMEWGLPATVEGLPPISGAGAIPEPLWAVAKQQWQAKGQPGKVAVAVSWDWLRFLASARADPASRKP
eukprot:EG_transcript_60352